jgi:aconitate hydratase
MAGEEAPRKAPDRLEVQGGQVGYWALSRAADADRVARLPYVIRVLLENTLRRVGTGAVEAHVEALSRWPEAREGDPQEFPFHPGRVILQDFTGVPVVADLAAMRAAVERLGGDPARVNPQSRTDLVIDHSVIVDVFRSPDAFARNVELEYERNGERYAFLRWAQGAFRDFNVVPPGAGIVHQVNLEYLATVVTTEERDGDTVAAPDTLVGTDSHTTMIGGLGVLGWGVGGIEAEAAMLGEPLMMTAPSIVGVRLTGELRRGVTATDLVLALTELLRRYGVVGRFVEFFGPGLAALSVPDRATVANMSPEFGATEGIFPVDGQVLEYLRATGRDERLVDLVERYFRAQGLFHEADSPEPSFPDLIDFDLDSVEPSMAGPRRPQDRVGLAGVRAATRGELAKGGRPEPESSGRELTDGSVVIAAITSCTNTSNPGVMVASGLVAKRALELGLMVPWWVKTSLAPGSPVVMRYLESAGLVEPLEKLGFGLVGFGCTTCIGNSGPLPEDVAREIDDRGLSTVAVLSGNRNFEGRIHPQVRMSFLASPPLVVAYGLAGTTDIDLSSEPLGEDQEGRPVRLDDLWPSPEEVAEVVRSAMDPEDYRSTFARIFDGDDRWRGLPVPQGNLYEWDPASTYLAEPPFLDGVGPEPEPVRDIHGARVLVVVGDTVTTDHISPAGSIAKDSPAARWLIAEGVDPSKLHSYGARRGHHEVMVRGTFANIRLRNQLLDGVEGGYTLTLPEEEQTTIFEAAERYREAGVPLAILAGKEYGAGSSRDWAAKGTALLGVRAVVAESFERIHRSNLVQMGVLPLEFPPGQNAASLGVTGREVIDVTGIEDGLRPRAMAHVEARREDGSVVTFDAVIRLDTPADVRIYQQGGILPAVARILSR